MKQLRRLRLHFSFFITNCRILVEACNLASMTSKYYMNLFGLAFCK